MQMNRDISDEAFSVNFSISSESMASKVDSSRSSSMGSPLNTSEEGSFYSSLPISSAGNAEEDVFMSRSESLIVSDNDNEQESEVSEVDDDSKHDGEDVSLNSSTFIDYKT